MDSPSYGAIESYEATWEISGKILSIYIQNKDSKLIKISSYKMVEKNGEIIAKGSKPWGRIRLFRKKKYWLKKN